MTSDLHQFLFLVRKHVIDLGHVLVRELLHLVLGPPVVVLGHKAAKDLFGGYFIVEPDPIKAAGALISAMAERRKGLGLQA